MQIIQYVHMHSPHEMMQWNILQWRMMITMNYLMMMTMNMMLYHYTDTIYHHICMMIMMGLYPMQPNHKSISYMGQQIVKGIMMMMMMMIERLPVQMCCVCEYITIANE
jgi:hypothetical protein